MCPSPWNLRIDDMAKNYIRRQVTSVGKGRIVNISGFAGYIVSAVTTAP